MAVGSVPDCISLISSLARLRRASRRPILVAAVDLEPHRPDVPAVPPHITLDRVGLGRGVTDDQEALDLLVTPYSRAKGKKRAGPRLSQIQ